MTPDPTLIEQALMVGTPVRCLADNCPIEWREDWRDWTGFIAGVHYEPRVGINYTVSDVWPPQDNGGLTDGFREGQLATLQGSAALPSEAQIEAGADCLRQAGTRGLNAEEAAVEVYTAMRATTPTAPNDRSRYDSVDVGRYRGIDATPTAPVQDDEWLWDRAAKAEAYLSECERRGFQTPRLSPTPETDLDTDALIVKMLHELHAHLPEDQRPMSMSDVSDEQAERARKAVNAVIVAACLSKPAGHHTSIAELEAAISTPETGLVEALWFDKAIRDHCDEHGPSGGAWNISMVLERLHRAASLSNVLPDEEK